MSNGTKPHTDRVPFGKYKGWPVRELIDDPKYLQWLVTRPWFRLAVAVSRQPWFDRIAGKADSRQEGD